MERLKIRITIWPVIAVAVLCTLLVPLAIVKYRQVCRHRWKEGAIVKINGLVGKEDWLKRQRDRLKAQPVVGGDLVGSGWLSDQFILMKSGEWIVFSSKCVEEDWRVGHIFVGKASNGRWYYSTYHFGAGMSALPMVCPLQPDDLLSFVKSYYLREFDERSDQGLQETWPP